MMLNGSLIKLIPPQLALGMLLLLGNGLLESAALAQRTADGQLFQQFVPARGTSVCLVPGDQIWVISTRCMQEGCEVGGPFHVLVFDGHQFAPSSLDAFVSNVQREPMKNVIHVHGDFTDFDWAIRRGNEVYQNAVVSCAARLPVRFIIWAWETERAAIPCRDFRIKTCRSVFEGQRLSQFIQQSGLSDSILIGYSMGAQVVLGAMDELSRLADLARQESSPSTPSWQILLAAPVIAPHFQPTPEQNADWNGLIEHLTILTNQSDRALKGVKRLHRLGNRYPAWDQYTLPCGLAVEPGRIQSLETACEVGGKHSIVRYSATNAFRSVVQGWLQQATLEGDFPSATTISAPQEASELAGPELSVESGVETE